MDHGGYKGSLKASVEKYTRRNVASSPEPLPQTAPSTAPVKAGPSTAPVKAGPSRTADIFYLDESTLVDENVLNNDNSSEEARSEEHTSELQSPCNLVCRLLLEKKKITRLRDKLLE